MPVNSQRHSFGYVAYRVIPFPWHIGFWLLVACLTVLLFNFENLRQVPFFYHCKIEISEKLKKKLKLNQSKIHSPNASIVHAENDTHPRRYGGICQK